MDNFCKAKKGDGLVTGLQRWSWSWDKMEGLHNTGERAPPCQDRLESRQQQCWPRGYRGHLACSLSPAGHLHTTTAINRVNKNIFLQIHHMEVVVLWWLRHRAPGSSLASPIGTAELLRMTTSYGKGYFGRMQIRHCISRLPYIFTVKKYRYLQINNFSYHFPHFSLIKKRFQIIKKATHFYVVATIKVLRREKIRFGCLHFPSS